MKTILIGLALIAMSSAASAQHDPYRPRYNYSGEPHAGPVASGSMYDAQGRNVGRTQTDSQGSTTIYGSDGRVIGRTATDSQGSTTFYDPSGRVTGKAVPERR